MADTMEGLMHGQRPIATTRTRRLPVLLKKSSNKRKSGESFGHVHGEQGTTAKKRAKLAATTNENETWASITQEHTRMLEAHSEFLAKLLKQSSSSAAENTSPRTTALLGFLARTHELIGQVKGMEAMTPAGTQPTTSTLRNASPNVQPKEEVIAKRKRTPNVSPSPSSAKQEGSETEGSPVKRLRAAPAAEVVGTGKMKTPAMKSRAGSRSVGGAFIRSQIPGTPTGTPRAASAPIAEVKTEVKVGATEKVSVEIKQEPEMETEDISAEVEAHLRAKERAKHKMVEGSKAKRRRRSSTVDVGERRSEKRVKRESLLGPGSGVSSRSSSRRTSGVVKGEGGEEERGRR